MALSVCVSVCAVDPCLLRTAELIDSFADETARVLVWLMDRHPSDQALCARACKLVSMIAIGARGARAARVTPLRATSVLVGCRPDP